MTQELIKKIKNLIKNNKYLEAEKLIDSYSESSDLLILYYFGLIKHKLSKNEVAIKYLKRIKQEIPEVLLLMANIYDDLIQYDNAINCLKKTIKIKKNYLKAYFNLGRIFLKKKLFNEAEKSFKKVLELDPSNYNAEFFLGVCYANYDFKKARKQYEKIIAKNPSHDKAHAELGKILLFTGNLKEGWNELQWSYGYLEDIYPDNIKEIPIWNGENINNQRLLIFREQGLGDEILYASCYSEIIHKTKKCFFVSDSRLTSLFKNSFPKATFIKEKVFSKHTDLSKIKPTARIQSTILPKYLRKTFNDFPKQKKYLIADKNKVKLWEKKLSKYKNKLKIGLAWGTSVQSSLKKDSGSLNNSLDEVKEFNLNEWKEFLSLDNLCLINLMYKNVKKEMAIFNSSNKNKIINFNDLDLRNDMDNTAALISNLDIVISAQTWIGDFASALGVKVIKFHNIYSYTRLGQKNIPWNNSLVFDDNNGSWKESFKLIKLLLSNKVEKK